MSFDSEIDTLAGEVHKVWQQICLDCGEPDCNYAAIELCVGAADSYMDPEAVQHMRAMFRNYGISNVMNALAERLILV